MFADAQGFQMITEKKLVLAAVRRVRPSQGRGRLRFLILRFCSGGTWRRNSWKPGAGDLDR